VAFSKHVTFMYVSYELYIGFVPHTHKKPTNKTTKNKASKKSKTKQNKTNKNKNKSKVIIST